MLPRCVRRDRARPIPHLRRDRAHPTTCHIFPGTLITLATSAAPHICAGTGLTPTTSAPGRGSLPPHLRRDRAHSHHICTGTGLTPTTSAPGPGSLPPHLHRDWAHSHHICPATWLIASTVRAHTRTHARTHARAHKRASVDLRVDVLAHQVQRELLHPPHAFAKPVPLPGGPASGPREPDVWVRLCARARACV
jgi:hypothetical protein